MRDFVPPFGRAAPFIVVLLGALSCVFVFRLIAAGIYDWMLMSGCAFVILGIVLSQGLPDRLEHALDRLVDRGALAVNPERLESFKLRLEAWIARYWAPCGGSIVAVAVAAAFVAAFDIAELEDRRFLLAGEILGGYFVGCYLGRMACYGSLGYLLSHEKIRVSIIPGHLDTVGGLKPVGDYFLRQAMIVGLPGVFTGAWLVLMRFRYFSHYQVWRAPYVGLLFVAILFEIMSFIAPLWWFHREMTRQKRILLHDADKLWPEIAGMQRALAECADSDEMKALKERLEERIGRYSMIEQLPVWPVDLKAKRVFSLSNVGLFIPLLAESTGVAKPWAELAQKLLERAGGGH